MYIYMDDHVLRRALHFEVEVAWKEARPKRTWKKQVDEQRVYQSINEVYFQINMYKNEQKVQFTVIHVQGNHFHLKEHITCNSISRIDRKKVEVEATYKHFPFVQCTKQLFT